MTPLVSIVIPMFNSEKCIYQCIYSCVHQQYENIEIVVVDDGSTDGSIRIVEEFYDKRISVVKLPQNGGTAHARNVGIKKSTGALIALLDSDDMLTEDSITARVAMFKKFPSVMIVGGYTYVVNGYGSSKAIRGQHEELKTRHGKFMQTSSAMLRRSVFDYGYFDESIRLNEDREFWGRMLSMYKLKAIKIARPVAYYRLHDSNKMSNVDQLEASIAQRSGPITDITEPIHFINASA